MFMRDKEEQIWKVVQIHTAIASSVKTSQEQNEEVSNQNLHWWLKKAWRESWIMINIMFI